MYNWGLAPFPFKISVSFKSSQFARPQILSFSLQAAEELFEPLVSPPQDQDTTAEY